MVLKNLLLRSFPNVCSSTDCGLETYEWTKDSELKDNWIRIIDYFYADANKDDYMDLIIRLKPDRQLFHGRHTHKLLLLLRYLKVNLLI